MNILKENAVGIDIPIQGFQTIIYDKLKALWGVTDAEFSMYGRAYRNNTTDGYSPEIYVGNDEYSDVFFDDTLKASAFFGVGETIAVQNNSTTAEAFIIFMVNLGQIKSGTNRQDEEVRVDVEKICKQRVYGFTMTGIVTGIDNVFREYTGFSKDDVKFMDQHPWHCFRFNFNLLYDINKC